MTVHHPHDADHAALRLLRDALDLDSGIERERLLAERCADDPDLLRKVREMLQRIDAEPDADMEMADSDPLAGTCLGPFRVLERIGQGGMGVVYRGEREGGDFRQEVALKLIRRGFDFDDIRARFLRERRILARLDHPNLARFIDGGVSAEGRPWFALDFVRGEPITRWCDTQQRSVRARVRLLLDVCNAVQYAHARLVVHRDLKPGNILVDADGRVRLLDFGIARLLAHDSSSAASTTIGQRGLLTPEYAAPEQFTGEAAGVATDVYGLGMVLYELIAGVLPYAVDRRDLISAERAIRELPPQSLTQAITRGGMQEQGERLRARVANLATYRKTVSGDLARIIDTAIAKEPERRYTSAQAFADDLSRWLNGTPVRVSGNGAGYRLRKFVARHRVAVALGAVAVLSLLIGTGAALLQAERAGVAAAMARTQATRAIAARDFLASLLGQASPENGGSGQTTVREVLDRARGRIRDELSGDAELRVEMSTLIGTVYNDLGEAEQGLNLLRETASQADAEASLSATIRANAHAEFARALLSRNERDEAANAAATAIDLLGDTPSDTLARAQSVLATTLYLQSRFGEALNAQRAAIDTTGRVHGLSSEKYAAAQLELSYFLSASANRADAIPVAEQALSSLERLHPDKDEPVVTRALWALGNALSTVDRDAEAVPHLRRARDMVDRIYGRDGTKYMRSLQLLGVAELFSGDVAAARENLERALKIAQSMSPDHPLVPVLLAQQASALLRSRDAEGALRVANEATEAARKAQRNDVLDNTLIVRTRALVALGRAGDALAEIESRLPEFRERGAKTLPGLLTVKAGALRTLGALAQAAAALEEAVAAGLPVSVSGRVDLSLEQARVALAQGDRAAARRHAENAKALLADVRAERAPELQEALDLLRPE